MKFPKRALTMFTTTLSLALATACTVAPDPCRTQSDCGGAACEDGLCADVSAQPAETSPNALPQGSTSIPTREDGERAPAAPTIPGTHVISETNPPAIEGGTQAPPAAPPIYLKRNGRNLTYDGRPYVTVGVNAYGLTGCQTDIPFTERELDSLFSELRPHSLTRTWAFESQGLAALEAVVARAEAHGQMLILSLANAYSDCGELDGVPAGGRAKQRAWYEGAYRTQYLPWVRTVVSRFKDSPAVGMWEIINSAGGGATGTIPNSVMRAFFDDVAATIKSIDGNHLVESGSQAEYAAGTTDFAFVHGGPNIDVASIHEYDYDYNASKTIVSPHFAPAVASMKSINKPLIVGESGIKGSDGPGCTLRTARRDAFKKKFDAYLQNGAVAVLAWSWRPLFDNTCAYESIYPGDPLMELLRTY